MIAMTDCADLLSKNETRERNMKNRSSVVLGLALCAAGCLQAQEDAGNEIGVVEQGLVGDAIAGLTATELERFADGKEEFGEMETIQQGLGPIFNDKSCGRCHSVGAIGGSGTQFEQRAGRLQNGVFDSLESAGGQLFEIFTVMNLTGNDRALVPNCTIKKNGEAIPAEANVRALRRTTALFGLGLVDNTPESAFATVRDAQPAAVRGHINHVHNIATGGTTMGKFGWKAQVPTLHQFSGDAYLNEMGITNPEFPDEQAPSGIGGAIADCDLVTDLEDDGEDVDAFTDFMQMLAPVEPTAQNSQAQAGSTVFSTIGCDTCHTRTLVSGNDGPIGALNGKTYHPYSDFLLHEMGSLGDSIGGNGEAGLTEMRTAPLWGLRLADAKHQLLHDGRATSLQDAILKHAGQGQGASTAFAALSTTDKNNLLAFLKTL